MFVCVFVHPSNAIPQKWIVGISAFFTLHIIYDLGMMHVFSQFCYYPRWLTSGHFIAWKTYFALVVEKYRTQQFLLKIHYYASLWCTFTSYHWVSNWAMLKKHIVPQQLKIIEYSCYNTFRFQIGTKMADWQPFYSSENMVCLST